MFRRRRQPPPTEQPWAPENTAGRLRRALAVPGPHDARVGHRRTYEANTDPTRIGLAVGARPAPAATAEVPAGHRANVLLLPRAASRPQPQAATGARRARGGAR